MSSRRAHTFDYGRRFTSPTLTNLLCLVIVSPTLVSACATIDLAQSSAWEHLDDMLFSIRFGVTDWVPGRKIIIEWTDDEVEVDHIYEAEMIGGFHHKGKVKVQLGENLATEFTILGHGTLNIKPTIDDPSCNSKDTTGAHKHGSKNDNTSESPGVKKGGTQVGKKEHKAALSAPPQAPAPSVPPPASPPLLPPDECELNAHYKVTASWNGGEAIEVSAATLNTELARSCAQHIFCMISHDTTVYAR